MESHPRIPYSLGQTLQPTGLEEIFICSTTMITLRPAALTQDVFVV
jgi:hypothetical protein